MPVWILLNEFASMVGKSEDEIMDLCNSGEIEHKEEDGEIYVDVGSSARLVLKNNSVVASGDDDDRQISHSFAEKTIGTIIAFHEKVLDAKEETLEALRRENKFLKEGLISMQEIYDEDRKTIETLTKQLEVAQEELEFMKRKYKLMWGQVIENHAK
jgi:predicted RNase H-like nuclease (RuvC/YqgF family)